MPPTTDVTVVSSPFRYIEWGPIVVGALGAAAISFVLLTFGSALGLSAVSPYPYRGVSATTFFIIAGLFAALVQVVSFSAGGYLAGRLRSPWAGGTEGERHFRDGAHGFAVWALGIVFGAAVLASGVSGVLKTATESAAMVSSGAAAGATQGAASRLSMEPVDLATDYLMRPAPVAAGAAPPAGTAGTAGAPTPLGAGAADQRPAAMAEAPVDRTAITRVFTTNLKNDQIAARDRTYLAQVVARQTGMSQADAEKRVDEAYAEAKSAEQKARDLANEARKKAILIAFLTAATMAIACAAACVAAGLGARDRDTRTGPYWMGAQRFW
jgi:hypothetical protein